MIFQLGQKAGDYEFIDIVDSTPNRVAYRVRNDGLNRFELLRVLGTAVEDDPEKNERFLREAHVHARLAHPNIVVFYNATTLDGHFVVTTELVEGVSLAERLELGPLPIDEAVSFLSQTLAALGCAHEHKVVHRSVTPASLIITPEGNVKLDGFNFARGDEDPDLTRMGTIPVDAHYLAPEQVKGNGILDTRSDLYAAGMILYEAITGRKALEARSLFDLMLAQVTTLPLAPSVVKPGLSSDWDTVVMKALAKQPADRYQTAAEFGQSIEAMRDVDHGPGANEPAPIRVRPIPEPEAPQEIPLDPPLSVIPDLPPPLPAHAFSRRPAAALMFALAFLCLTMLFYMVSRK